jgi:predicted acyl esterase
MLIVLKAEGVTCNLVGGVVRTRFGKGFTEEKLINLGKVCTQSTDGWTTSYAFAPGDKLRIAVTSSNLPELASNPST